VDERDVDRLLREHQAIIDAWYENWLRQQKLRVEELFARKRRRALSNDKDGTP
jgi:hypothetical protein